MRNSGLRITSKKRKGTLCCTGMLAFTRPPRSVNAAEPLVGSFDRTEQTIQKSREIFYEDMRSFDARNLAVRIVKEEAAMDDSHWPYPGKGQLGWGGTQGRTIENITGFSVSTSQRCKQHPTERAAREIRARLISPE